MKTFLLAHNFLVILNWVAAAEAVCSCNLLIDNYANFDENRKSSGQYTSGMYITALPKSAVSLTISLDDGTTTNLMADPAKKGSLSQPAKIAISLPILIGRIPKRIATM